MPIIPPIYTPPLTPSANLRTANDILVEISLHLVEDVVNTTLTAAVTGAGSQSVTVGSVVGMYAGAQVVISNADGTEPTIATIATINQATLTITATFAQAYAAGSTLLGGTFPTQQPSDPLFTQAEVLTYLAQTQNEFLMRVPLIYQFTQQWATLGQEFQALPANAIELERVSIGGSRLYEVSQTELSMQDPQWFYDNPAASPTAWFEDRAGFYNWGLSPVPQGEFLCSLVTSMRGPETLVLTDLMLVPSICCHYVKYGTLATMWNKNGETQSPTMARLARKRFDTGVGIMSRFLDGVTNAPGKRG
jgi:hypothetical protein